MGLSVPLVAIALLSTALRKVRFEEGSDDMTIEGGGKSENCKSKEGGSRFEVEGAIENSHEAKSQKGSCVEL